MKELAEEKSASTESPEELEDKTAIKPTRTHHPIAWMLFGAVATIFMSTYWDTVQENKILKAMVAQNITPTARLKRTGFDFTQPTNEIDWNGYKVELLPLPKPYRETKVEI